MDERQLIPVNTTTGVAVAVLALARYVGSTDPNLAPFLRRALDSAEAIGLASVDLQLLKTIIASLPLG